MDGLELFINTGKSHLEMENWGYLHDIWKSPDVDIHKPSRSS